MQRIRKAKSLPRIRLLMKSPGTSEPEKKTIQGRLKERLLADVINQAAARCGHSNPEKDKPDKPEDQDRKGEADDQEQ
jgi:hypothetical protein